ncbi:MAG TPA: enoyl-CoA hydratase [Vineibacter sp.]|nr:enoyl-CoA hydratase [Vineibacter sp.]
MSSGPFVHVRHDERPALAGVAYVTIDNRAKLNALNSSVIRAFVAAVEQLGTDPALRAIVVTGWGDKAFVGGADIQELSTLHQPGAARAFITGVHEACRCLRDCPAPVIGRVNGFTLGAGLELMAACDMRVAVEGAKLGMPEVRFGMPSVVEAALFPGMIGWGRTRQMLLLGDMIPAEEALQWGLVERVVPAAELDAAVDTWLTSLAANSVRGVRLQKKLIRAWETLPMEQAVQRGIDIFAETHEIAEPRELLQRFLDHQAARKK